MSRTLGLLGRGIAGWAGITSMLCIGGSLNVMANAPIDADARSEMSAVAVVRAYKKASKSGLISLDFGSPVREAESRRTFSNWWCTKKPTEIAVEELNRLLEANCQARSGRWSKHDAKTVWCEDAKGEGLLFLGVVGGNVWDSAALKSYTVPAPQRRQFNCSERGNVEHRDISVDLTEPTNAPILDQAVAGRFGYIPTLDRYRKRFASASSAAEWESFLSDYADFDPDGLRAKAQANLDAAKSSEYRAEFQSIASTDDIEAFERRYANDDPEGLVPKAAALRPKLAKHEMQERNRRIAEADRAARERDARKASLPNGTRLCHRGSGSFQDYTGWAVLGKPQYRDVPAAISMVGFLEGRSGEEFQIRVSGIAAEEKNGETMTLESLKYKGLQLSPGQIFWDDIGEWEPCD